MWRKVQCEQWGQRAGSTRKESAVSLHREGAESSWRGASAALLSAAAQLQTSEDQHLRQAHWCCSSQARRLVVPRHLCLPLAHSSCTSAFSAVRHGRVLAGPSAARCRHLLQHKLGQQLVEALGALVHGDVAHALQCGAKGSSLASLAGRGTADLMARKRHMAESGRQLPCCACLCTRLI